MSLSHLPRYSIALFLVILFVFVTRHPVVSTVTAQTVPTRTPTPPPDEPPDDGDDPPPGGGDNPTAVPTSTGQALATATQQSGGAQVTPSIADDFLPTAETCSMDPTVQSLAAGVNVRSGPGINYEVVGALQYLEVRPIIGRAEDSAWWQITLEDNTEGWVADSVVQVSGYTGAVALVDSPELPDGATPTPGATWEPTPVPGCTPQPTATATAAASATSSGPSSNQPETGGMEEASRTPTATRATATATTAPTETATTERVEPAATVTPAPLPGEEADSSGSNIPWLPIAGVGLILAAAVIFVVRRGAA